MTRVLVLATTTGYQTRMFGEAAARLGVELVFATDRCDHLDDPWADGAIAVRFHDEGPSADAIVRALEGRPINGVLALGDRPTVLAARVAELLGLPGHPPDAAAAARDKRTSRARLGAAGLPTPAGFAVPITRDPASLLPQVPFPCVVKPAALSGSRGVIRADTPDAFVAAFGRVRRLLESPDIQALRDPLADIIQVESYIDGDEYAVEGVLEHGVLRVLAIFDKPVPLVGPFFEETVYVTPSQAGAGRQQAIRHAVGAAVDALGLRHGPVHAECRVSGDLVFVLEVAARPIGGLCARALRFTDPGGAAAGLEEVLLRHATGESLDGWRREEAASGVMMIPIPRGGVYRHVAGVDDALQVDGVDEVRVTAKPDQRLVPLPEGASYLGFIFARGAAPDDVVRALDAAHARLHFTIDPELPVMA
ncbi:MAG: ATP-grasp domain-containing protein [Acidobacteriota bacterium]